MAGVKGSRGGGGRSGGGSRTIEGGRLFFGKQRERVRPKKL